MIASQIRQKYLDFFISKGHKLIPAASLVPENDPTTLFTSSGMQQLVPYLKGEPHPMGQRLVDSQPSIRLQDIEEVGDSCHTTLFEMLGNWSLGDPASPDGIGQGGYFKKEQLPWFWEFLTKELKLPGEKLYVSVFEGNKDVPKDTKSVEIWESLGVPKDHLFYYGVEKNWWSRSGTPEQMPAGEIGGPDSEVFYDFGEGLKLHENSSYKNEKCHPNCQCGRFLEIGNSVFMQYEKKADGKLTELSQKNVDFGGGLERLAAAANNNPDIFQIDLFAPLIRIIEAVSNKKSYQDKENQKAMRIIADHMRASTFLLTNGVTPSNKSQGYILRRLLRRAAVNLQNLKDNLEIEDFIGFSDKVIESYGDIYFKGVDKNQIKDQIATEINRFRKILTEVTPRARKYAEDFVKLMKLAATDKKLIQSDTYYDNLAKNVFYVYQTYGYPPELMIEDLDSAEINFNRSRFDEYFQKFITEHQELSRTASVGMFKGGLADHSEMVTKYHTATHLLNAALKEVLGPHIIQKGSNITAERLRFDFPNPEKLSEEQIKKVEELVNEKIKENLPVTMETMSLEDAKKSQANAVFSDRYGDQVKVYSIGDFSKEVCGGPHIDFTGKLGKFKIIKEEAVSAGT
ncbi:alanine--tRNA ligase, partial [Patescibacteria group bacterium]|nr:alanine--tRNA ligase [Patescibacteria group bacterium]